MNPLRVTHVITTIQRGGAEKQLLILVQEQIKIGWEVEICYLKNEPELLQDFVAVGAYVNADAANRNLLKQLFVLKKIAGGPSAVIHAHLPQSELLMAIVSRKRNFIVTRHNAEEFYPSSVRWLSRILAQFVSRRAIRIIAISEAVRTFNVKEKQVLKTDIGKLKTVYYGYPESTSKIKRELQSGSFVFGTISRLVPQKDLPTLLYAFAEISKIYPSTKLEIVGVGDLERELKDIAAKLDLTQKINWNGKIANIESFLSTINAFVLTSKYEGFGLVLLEAMAANLPIIAAHNSAIPEVLGEHGGLYFETGDIASLTQKLKLVVDNQSLQRLKLIPSEQLLKFSAPKMAAQTIEIYSEVIELSS